VRPPPPPTAPPAGYTIDEKFTQKSPDGSVTIEQYVNKATDDWKWRSGRGRRARSQQLGSEDAGYPADFRFTNDPEMDRIACKRKARCEQTLYLVPPRSAGLRGRDEAAAR